MVCICPDGLCQGERLDGAGNVRRHGDADERQHGADDGLGGLKWWSYRKFSKERSLLSYCSVKSLKDKRDGHKWRMG